MTDLAMVLKQNREKRVPQNRGSPAHELRAFSPQEVVGFSALPFLLLSDLPSALPSAFPSEPRINSTKALAARGKWRSRRENKPDSRHKPGALMGMIFQAPATAASFR